MYLTKGQKTGLIILGLILGSITTKVFFGGGITPTSSPVDFNNTTIEEFDSMLEEIKSK